MIFFLIFEKILITAYFIKKVKRLKLNFFFVAKEQ